MSLKTFHIFFIMVAALFCLLTAVWLFVSSESTGMMKAFGAASGVAGVALVIYGIWFIRKKGKTIIV